VNEIPAKSSGKKRPLPPAGTALAPLPPLDGWTPYEQNAIHDIRTWVQRQPTRVDRAFELSGKPIEALMGRALRNERAQAAFNNAIEGLLKLLNEWATAAAPGPPLDRYRKRGAQAEAREDIATLDLGVVDKVAQPYYRKYVTGLAAEGAAAGGASILSPAAALVALAADVPAVVGGSLHAAASHQAAYGFDCANPKEKEITMQLLFLSTEVTDAGKQVGLMAVYRAAAELSGRTTWQQLEQQLLVRIIRKQGENVGVRVTQRKLGQILPAVGAVIGASFNAYYADKVCTAAYQTCRARFLARKYGLQVEEIVGLASDKDQGTSA
jgi:hypothetical protein